MMKKLIFLTLLICFFCCSSSNAAIFTMPDDCANLQSCFSLMSGGDQLIIRNGTYTGTANIINDNNRPPVGTSTAYTKVTAENPGMVFLGDASVDTAYLHFASGGGDVYYEFNGLVWLGGFNLIYGTNYIKFFNCGAGSNIVDSASVNFNPNHSSYLLFEDCYAWGGGRYKFLSYESDHIIYRRCVGRVGAVNTSHDGRVEPIGGFGFYQSSYCEAQNCILIDSKTSDYWTYESLVGAFTLPNGGGSNIAFRGCIGLNSEMPLHGEASGYTSMIVFENMIGWDVTTGTLLRGVIDYDHLTLGDIDTNMANYAAFQQYEGAITLHDSIFTGISATNGAVSGSGITADYNYYWNNYNNYGSSSLGSHDVTNINPLTASLLYLPRIEASSPLSGVASDGGDIGATVLKRIGTSGTLYGEPGYNTVTDEDLWPWENEEIIKNNMSTYIHPNISATRGFCASGQTLTKYIWEYLGNPIPSDIYGSPTCSDGIQNGDETGIDCGGSCPACAGGGGSGQAGYSALKRANFSMSKFVNFTE